MTSRYWRVLVACLGFAGLCASLRAQEGFTLLFNGKDLSGWVYGQRADGTENRTGKGYQVEGGVLFTTKEDGGNLFTAKEYADFVLRFEFKLTENANNGIGIRAPLQGDAAYVGMEIQVLDDSGSEYRNLRPAQYHGSIYQMFPATRGHQKPVGEWNVEEITAKGRQITVKLNGIDDHRGQPGRGQRRCGARQTSRPDQAGRIAWHRQYPRPHRPARSWDASRVQEYQNQRTLNLFQHFG